MAERKPLVINVLAEENYQDCHIKGSIHVPYDELRDYAQNLNKNQEIVVYCAHYDCPKSKQAYELLQKMGFTNIAAYEGGIREWLQLGLPVQGKCKADYLKEPNKKPQLQTKIKTVDAQELKKKL